MMINKSTQDRERRKKEQEKTIKLLGAKIDEYLKLGNSSGDPVAHSLLNEVKATLQTQIHINSENEDTSMVAESLRDIKNALNRMEGVRKNNEPTTSYATAATPSTSRAQVGPNPTYNLRHPRPQKTKELSPSEAKRAREVTLRFTNEADRERVRQLPTQELVESLQKNVGGIVGISRLTSGDIRIHAESAEIKKTLHENTKWITAVAASATVQRRTFAVRASGVKVEHIDATNQNQIIQYLQTANARLHPGLKITRIAWSFRAIKEKKAYSSLHIEVETPAMANRLINEGFLVDHEIKNCEKFAKSCKLTQCFNCYKYGHIGKRCRNPTACGHCAGGHPTNECNPETTGRQKRCACCDERGHVAWAPTCKLRIQEMSKIEKARKSSSQLFATGDPIVARSFIFSSQAPTDKESNAALGEATESPVNGIPKVVSSKKRKTAPAGSHEVSPAGPSRPTGTSWKDTEIMKPMNMQRAMAKPILGRPPNTSTTMAATPAPTRTNPAAHPLQPSPPTPDTPPPLDDQGLITRTAPATDVMEEGCL